MNTLVKSLIAIALVVGAIAALFFSGEHMSGSVVGAQLMSSTTRFGGYVVLILLIAALGSGVVWMLFGKTE